MEKMKKAYSLYLSCFLNLRFSQKTQLNHTGVTSKKERMEMGYVYINRLRERRKNLSCWLALCMSEESNAAEKPPLLPLWRCQCPQTPNGWFLIYRYLFNGPQLSLNV